MTGQTGGTGENLFAVSPHNTTSHRRSRSLLYLPHQQDEGITRTYRVH
jgi:hypothetical protein